MAKKADKAIIIGIDGAIVPRLYRFCKEGKLPTINKLFVEQGVWSPNCLVPLPTITPPNWAAISTGAWPSTVHITDFNVHVPGDELDELHQGLFSDDVHAETLYEAIAKAGKKSIMLNYPSTWPPKLEDSIVVGGGSLSINGWAQRIAFGGQKGALQRRQQERGEEAGLYTYAAAALYSTTEYDGSTSVKFEEPGGWSNIPGSGKALAASMPLTLKSTMYKMEPVTWHILVQDGKAMVCENKDTATAIATLAEGQWSQAITREFKMEQGPKKAVFKMKLVELSPNAEKFRLLMTNISALDGWSHPASIAAEITSEQGLPGAGSAWGGWGRGAKIRGWYDLDTVVEIQDMDNMFYADAAAYLLKNKPWDFYMMHAHAPDHMYHSISDALNNPDPAARKPFEDAELAICQSIDRMCAKIFGCADDNTIMAMVSDHGAKPHGGRFGINKILQQGGLLSRDENSVIDWSKTKASGMGSTYVWINVKGLYPHEGIVDPKDYAEVQEEVIRCLYDFTDPETGRKPIALALKREDARMIGSHGEWVGDVVYGLTGYGPDQHGCHIPTAQFGMGDLHGLFLLSGPNIKKGVLLERTVWILDMVPTICYLTGWPVPAQAEGAVIYQAMEDTNIG